MRRSGLSKYDAPLRIQYQWGYEAFKRGGKLIKVGDKTTFQENRPNIDPNTMQYREWERGWNDAYHENLNKGKTNDTRRRGETVDEE
tara:strand:- start:28 stop:288 length:261 start_codon:yes stop_codon:yes gene_type:complete